MLAWENLAGLLEHAPDLDVTGGSFPQTREEQRQAQANATDIKLGREQMGKEAWAAAEKAFKRVLDRDPINLEARAGFAQAEANREHHEALRAAESAMAAGDLGQALRALVDVRADAHYAPQADDLREKAETAIAERALADARLACDEEEWRTCHRWATEYLAREPAAVIGRALVREAENAMRTRHVAFVPWDIDEQAREARASLLINYSDKGVREAALRYAAGDLSEALRRAKTLRGRLGARRLYDLLQQIKRSRASAARAAEAGNPRAVLRELQRAYEADARLLPEGHVGVLRNELRDDLARAYLTEGEAVFNRGGYAKAFVHWRAGLRISPENPALLQAMDKLQERAQAFVGSIPSDPVLSQEDCARLRVVLSMTEHSSQLRREAQEALRRCKPR